MFTLPVFEILRFKGGSVLSGSQVAKELIFVKLQTSVRIKLSLYKKGVVNGPLQCIKNEVFHEEFLQ